MLALAKDLVKRILYREKLEEDGPPSIHRLILDPIAPESDLTPVINGRKGHLLCEDLFGLC